MQLTEASQARGYGLRSQRQPESNHDTQYCLQIISAGSACPPDRRSEPSYLVMAMDGVFESGVTLFNLGLSDDIPTDALDLVLV